MKTEDQRFTVNKNLKIMTPSEKASYLYMKYYGIPLYVKTVKQCCYYLIDEVIANIESSSEVTDDRIKYWKEVREEIGKMV